MPTYSKSHINFDTYEPFELQIQYNLFVLILYIYCHFSTTLQQHWVLQVRERDLWKDPHISHECLLSIKPTDS